MDVGAPSSSGYSASATPRLAQALSTFERSPGPASQRDPVRLLIVATVRLYREGLSQLLRESPDVHLVGVFATAADAAAELQQREPDVVLVDVPREVRVDTIRAILRLRGACRVVAFGVAEVEHEVLELAEAGAAGYVSDQASVSQLLRAVRAASREELHCSPRIAAALLRRVGRPAAPTGGRRLPPDAENLTEREAEVLDLIGSGLSNKQIARRLHIALPTVKNHVHSILQKLHAGSRTEALARHRQWSMGTSPEGPSSTWT